MRELRVHRPKSLIFLCGGQQNQALEVVPSVREALLRHIPDRGQVGVSTIILAERATEALAESNFSNLLDLEEYIAAVVDAVVLIVESAGSICELGAFAKTDEIRRKLVIIIANIHNNGRSFITLGALKYIAESADSAEIHPFDWHEHNGGMVVPEYALNGMVTEINSAIDRVVARPKFNPGSIGHRIYLTLALCHILRGAKLGELKECLELALPVKVPESELKKYLNILQICGLLERVANGAKHIHYVSLVDRLPIVAAFRAGAAAGERNILRWLSEISADIRDEDPVRLELFREHNHGG